MKHRIETTMMRIAIVITHNFSQAHAKAASKAKHPMPTSSIPSHITILLFMARSTRPAQAKSPSAALTGGGL